MYRVHAYRTWRGRSRILRLIQFAKFSSQDAQGSIQFLHQIGVIFGHPARGGLVCSALLEDASVIGMMDRPGGEQAGYVGDFALEALNADRNHKIVHGPIRPRNDIDAAHRCGGSQVISQRAGDARLGTTPWTLDLSPIRTAAAMSDVVRSLALYMRVREARLNIVLLAPFGSCVVWD